MKTKEEIQNEIIKCREKFATGILFTFNMIDKEEMDYSSVISGLIQGTHMALMEMTGQKNNMLEYSHMVNSFVVDYLMKYGSIKEEEPADEKPEPGVEEVIVPENGDDQKANETENL